jgi:hypothetical protein
LISPVAQSPERIAIKKSASPFRDRRIGDYEHAADLQSVFTDEMPQAMYFNAATNSISR